MTSLPPQQLSHYSVERRSWQERTSTAICRHDACAWKYRGVDLASTQAAGEQHVAEVGHAVMIYRELYREVIVAGSVPCTQCEERGYPHLDCVTCGGAAYLPAVAMTGERS